MSPPSGVAAENSDNKYIPVSTNPPVKEEDEGDDETKPKQEENKKIDEETINDNDAEIVVPPDGGWGWVIVFASFMCNMIVDGIIFSFGMFLTQIATTFTVSKAHVSLVGSLMSGFYLMAGPFVSALANRYGFRFVAIIGSIVGAAAFVLSYFATSIEFLWISYGVLGGKRYKLFTLLKRVVKVYLQRKL